VPLTLTSSWDMGRGIIWAKADSDRAARLLTLHLSRAGGIPTCG